MSLSKQDKKAIAEMIVGECSKATSTAENLLHAPQACCMIEALTVVANCTKDTTLRSGDRTEKFEYLRTPDSFKASLYQVINAMCDAFRTAQNSMDRIHIGLGGMPDLMNDSLEAMDNYNDPDSDAQGIIDYALDTIKKSATNCVKAAKDADDDCKKALKVIEELLQAAIATQGRNEHRQEAAKIELLEQESLKIQKEKLLADLEEQVREQKIVVQQVMDDYKSRMAQSTEFTGVVGAMFIDNLNTLIQSVGKTAENIGAIAGNLPTTVLKVLQNDFLQSKSTINKEDLMGQAMEGVLVELIEDIVRQSYDDVVLSAETHINNLKCANTQKTPSKMGQMLRKTSKNLIEALQTVKKGDENAQKQFETAKTAAELNLKVYEKAEEKMNDSINLDKARKMTSEERQTYMRIKLDNLKISKQTLAEERNLQDKLRKDKTEADEELCKIMGNLERLKIEEVDLKDVLYYLRQGIQQLSKVQIAWGNIVTFFNRIKNTVEGSLVFHIDGMTTNVQNAIDQHDGNVSVYKRRIILREVTKACAVANILMQSAELYMDISKKYVMPTIDRSILNMALSKEEAQARQYDIVSNFHKIKSAVEDTITDHSGGLSHEVYAKLRDQGFDVGRAIEYHSKSCSSKK